MNLYYRDTNRVKRQGLLPTFSKLLGMLAIFFLVGVASCSKNADPTPDPEPLDLTQVDIDLDAGIIIGTTRAMEYSLNSTDGTDGIWTVATNVSTAVTFVEGKVYIRQAANPTNFRLVKTIGPGMIIIVDLTTVDVNVAEGHLTGTTAGMEYSLTSANGRNGLWAAASDGNTTVDFEAGNVYVREAADHTHFRLVTTIAPATDAPQLMADDEEDTIIGLSEIHEYKIDDGEWTAGTVVPDLTGTVMVQVRFPATATLLASKVQTLYFTGFVTVPPVWFEDFSAYTVGTTYTFGSPPSGTLFNTDWSVLNGGASNLGRTTYSIKSESGNQYLEIRNGAEHLVSPAIPRTENAVVEWKVRINAISDIVVTGYDVLPGSSVANAGVMRIHLITSSGITTLRGYPGDANAGVYTIENNITLYDQWITFRIEIIAHSPTENRYKVYMNGNQVGDLDGYPTIANNNAIQQIRLRNLKTSNDATKYADFSELKVAEAP